MSSRFLSDQTKRWIRTLLTNRYFWGGLVVLLAVGAGLYLLFNNVVMPAYTRHDVSVNVPGVVGEPFEEAQQALEERGLRVERIAGQYNPDLPRGVVSDQNPPPNSSVKPDRRVYLTVNIGRTPMVRVPSLEGSSVREARNRLQAVGLEVEDVRPDSIPSPYENTITRQEPASGDSLSRGESVTLWYSTGLGDEYVTVPDVTGLTVEEATEELLDLKLRSVLVRASGEETDESESEDREVVRQSPEADTQIRQGGEIRLFLESPEEEEEE